MKPAKNLFSSLLLWLLIALGLLAGFHWMRTCPIKVREENTCSSCKGTGIIECTTCNGFGTVEKLETCPKCKGTGKTAMKFGNNPRGAPCTQCRGTGQIEMRGECPECKGSQKMRCPTCGGTGKTVLSSTAQATAVFMAPSPWERIRHYFKLPIDRNPCPQRGILGGYEIVTHYVHLRSGNQTARIIAWGEFKQAGYPWQMTAEVEFQNKAGRKFSKTIEFSVQDRTLGNSQVIK